MGSQIKRLQYRYDVRGNRSALIDHDGGRFTYSYDAVNRITQVINPQGDRTSYSYDDASRRTLKKLANGTRASFSYDPAGNLTKLYNLKSDGTVISSFDYVYDKVGNRTAVLEAGGSRVTWSYDATYQLTGEHRTGSNPYRDTYTFDPTGNRTLKNHDGARTTSTYDAANQLRYTQDVSGRTTYTFDADGNQQRILAPGGDRTTYVWDYENRMTRVELPSGIRNTMAYEPEGLRVKLEESTGVKKFVWDEQNYLAETDGSNDTQVVYTNERRRYGNLVSQRRLASGVWTPHWYHFDAIGSTRELTTSGQVVSDTRLYDAWGARLSHTGVTVAEFQYVGELEYLCEPDTALLYVRARIYVPDRGTWLSPDPMALGLQNSPIRCLFTYASNNPLVATDPSGLYTIGGQITVPPTLEKRFQQWYEKEKARGKWWENLPKCPCNIEFGCDGEPKSPDPDVWLDPKPKRDFPRGPLYSLPELGYRAILWTEPPDLHPKAVWDMRLKRPVDGRGNQCTYTADGELITSGLGAGTVDNRYYGGADYDTFGPVLGNILGGISDVSDKWKHLQHDVIPFWAAYLLDGKNYGPHVKMYLEVRPPHVREECEGIAVGGVPLK